MAAEFKVILTIDSQGNAKIEEVKRSLESVGTAAEGANQKGAASADDFAGALMRQLGIYALATAAVYKLGQTIVGGFKAGIQEIDDFKLTTIGVAATITDMAVDQSKGQENFNQALAYSQGMYNELELAAARYFASGKDMTQAWNILAQKGIVLKHEEIDALGIIVDRIKLSTQGQVAALQIAQELRSMITGQARATDQVGMLLKDRIPNLEEELRKHRQIGDVVTWLASQFKGLEFASGKIQETLESQYSTLGTLVTQVGRGGLGGAYHDIVNLVSQINEYLTTHKDDLAVGIAKGWATIAWAIEKAADANERLNKATSIEMPADQSQRTLGQQAAVGFKEAFDPLNWANVLLVSTKYLWDGIWDGTERAGKSYMGLVDKTQMLFNWTSKTSDLITGSEYWHWAIDTEGPKKEIDQVKDKIQSVIDLVSRTYTFAINAVVSGLPSWFGGGGTAPGAMPERKLTVPDTSLAAAQERARLKALGKFQIMSPDFGLLELPEWVMQSSKPPDSKSGGGKEPKGGGGKGAEGALNSMQSLMDRLQQDIAKLSGGGIAAVDAWAVHTRNEIAKLVAKGADGAEALILLDRDVAFKKMKLHGEVDQHIAKGSGDAYLAIAADSNKWLEKAGGDIKQIMALWDEKSRKEWEADVKNYIQRLGLEKSLYDQAARLSPVWSEQVHWKRMALEKDIEANRYAEALKLNKLELARIISRSQAEEFRGRQALLDQQKRFNFEMENNKGLSGWAWSRAKEADQRNTIKDMMGGLESGFQNAFSGGLQGVLTKDKATLKKISETLWTSGIGEIHKGSITRLFDSAAKMLRPEGPGGLAAAGGAAGGGNVTGQLGQAAQGLQKASAGFNLNTAQFGLAAGGLLLSGIGIATNSQFLVYAGTVLQMAGLAIQLYEALTATTTVVAMTGAAAALSGSAALLSSAATMMMIVSIKQSIPIIGHTGLELPRFHLGSDEFPAVLQRGEWVINRDAVSALRDSYGPGAFKMFNSGRVPAVPAPVAVGGYGGGGQPVEHHEHYYDNRKVSFAPVVQVNYPMSRIERQAFAKDLVEDLDRETNRSGQEARGIRR